MPARTNEFQRLVLLVQRALVDKGALVRESVELPVGDGNEFREIDILIETAVGPYELKVAVEAKDESRPMTMERFDSLLGKYFVGGGLIVNGLVIVTAKGFSRTVKKRARTLGITLLTLRKALELDWGTSFLPAPPPFRRFPIVLQVYVNGSAEPADDQLLTRPVTCSLGHSHGSLTRLASEMFWKLAVKSHQDALLAKEKQAIEEKTPQKVRVDIGFADPHVPYVGCADGPLRVDTLGFVVSLGGTKDPAERSPPQFTFNMTPHVCGITLGGIEQPADIANVLQEGRIICECCGKDMGSPFKYVNECAQQFLSRDGAKLLAEGLAKSPNGHVRMELSTPMHKRWTLHFRELVLRPNAINFGLHAANATGKATCEPFELVGDDGTIGKFTRVRAFVAGKELSILAPLDAPAERLVLSINNGPTQPSTKSVRLDEGRGS